MILKTPEMTGTKSKFRSKFRFRLDSVPTTGRNFAGILNLASHPSPTYASRQFYGIAAAENLLVYGADVGNAFVEAPPPKQGAHIQPDHAFVEWWNARGFPSLLPGQVIPVMRAMQGHPESSRLWEKHIDRIIKKRGFKPTVHKPCLYLGYI
jgi:hypothetical protein